MDRLSWLVRATKYTASRQGKVVLCHVRSCVNIATKICEDVLAVAQKKGMLDEFITRFNKKRRKRASTMDMVEKGGAKTAERKPP